MSKELDQLAKEFIKIPTVVLRKDISLYGKNFQAEVMGFSRDIERTAKKDKTGKVVLVAVLYE